MVEITVGVPVYNGAQCLEECLQCLERQTHREFTVLIYDNASDDATPDIARRFTRRDSRFNYVRQPFNKGAAPNFINALEAAQTPYFLWRADDDLTDDRYLEVTHRLLKTTPGARLAVGVVRRMDSGGGIKAIYAPPRLFGPELWQIRQILTYSPPAWFYGLWDREALNKDYHAAWSAYPHAWSHDNLVMFPTLLDRRIAWSNETVFIQRRVARQYDFKPRFAPADFPREMMNLRRQFYNYCQTVLDARPTSPSRRLALDLIVWLYASRRVYKLRRYAREKIRALIVHGGDGKSPATEKV